MSVFPLLSHEFDFAPAKSINKTWDIYKIINAMYLDNLLVASDMWIDVLIKLFLLEKKLDVTEGIFMQIDLPIPNSKKIFHIFKINL